MKRLVQEFFLSAPLITSPDALRSFTKLVLDDPTAGPQVLVFSLDQMDWFHLEHDPLVYDLLLCDLFPHLTSLRHFIGYNGCPISFAAFEALAEAAGNTLTKVQNLAIEDSEAVSSAAFHHLKCLVELQIWSLPPLRHDESDVGYDCLSTLRDVTFYDVSPCVNFFTLLK